MFPHWNIMDRQTYGKSLNKSKWLFIFCIQYVNISLLNWVQWIARNVCFVLKQFERSIVQPFWLNVLLLCWKASTLTTQAHTYPTIHIVHVCDVIIRRTSNSNNKTNTHKHTDTRMYAHCYCIFAHKRNN